MENEPSGFILPDNPGLTARALLGPLIADAPIGLALVDERFRYVFINATQAGFNELPVSEHRGKTVRSVVGETLWRQLEPFFKRALRGELIRSHEVTSFSRHYPGVRRHYLASFYPVRSDRRTVTGVGTVVTDITERKQNEALITGQNRILEGIATDAPLLETLTVLASFMEDQLPNIHTMVLLAEKADADHCKLVPFTAPRLPLDFAADLWKAIEALSTGVEADDRAEQIIAPLFTAADKGVFQREGVPASPAACWVMPIMGKDGHKIGALGIFLPDLRDPTPRERSFVDTAVHTARIAIERDRELVRRRELLRDMLGSLTEGRLILCLSESDLPAPYGEVGMAPMALSSEVLRDLRHAVTDVATHLRMTEDRKYDLEAAVGEAAMNAVVHAEGGIGQVFANNESGQIQVWIRDHGVGIAEESLHRATLERGFSTGGTLGHGFWMILNTIDKVYLFTSPEGTTIVLQHGALPAPVDDWPGVF